MKWAEAGTAHEISDWPALGLGLGLGVGDTVQVVERYTTGRSSYQ